MPSFDSAGVEIAYEDVGKGRPIVLVHGFAASFEMNWRAPGWVDALVSDGRRVVGLDCRGHGSSGKPHDEAAYGGSQMSEPVIGCNNNCGSDSRISMYSVTKLLSSRRPVDSITLNLNTSFLNDIIYTLINDRTGRTRKCRVNPWNR